MHGMRLPVDAMLVVRAFELWTHESDIRSAVDALSGEAWVVKFGPLWDKWDRPVREGANAPGHEVIVPDAAVMAQWRDGLRPVTDRYLADLAGRGFPGARAAYDRLAGMMRR